MSADNEDKFNEVKYHDTFAIHEIKYNKTKIIQPKAAQLGVIPEHPFRAYIVGASGSGKTNLMEAIWLFLKDFQFGNIELRIQEKNIPGLSSNRSF